MLKELSGKKIIVYGNLKQMRDLQYVFHELTICAYTEKEEEIETFIKEGYFVIVCRGKDKLLPDNLSGEDYKRIYCMDDDIIEELNFSVREQCSNKKIVIWGTGVRCEEFERKILEKNMDIPVYGYVDSDVKKQGKLRKDCLIFGPEQITPEKYYVIIAAGYDKYAEITTALRNRGYRQDEYVYFRTVLDDVAAYFRKTYSSETCYDVECINKDSSVRIKGNGDVCTCCMAYESVYGNLFETPFKQVWQSRRATISRLALENRTYVFCDRERCPFLAYKKGRKFTEAELEKRDYRIWKEEYPDSVAPEVDTTCNLYCTSCRNKIFVDKRPYIQCYTDMVMERLVDLPIRFLINTVGEAFASKYCLSIIHDERTRRRGNISIYSNGTLISPTVLDQLLNEYDTVELSISVDAATKATYEKIRRNGNFSVLCSNLEYMAEQRKKGKVSFFQVNYVLQADNIKEFDQFVSYVKGLGVDNIAVNAIEKWPVFTDEEYERASLFRDGEIKEEFRKYFTEALIRDDRINFHNLANRIGAVPKRMYLI